MFYILVLVTLHGWLTVSIEQDMSNLVTLFSGDLINYLFDGTAGDFYFPMPRMFIETLRFWWQV